MKPKQSYTRRELALELFPQCRPEQAVRNLDRHIRKCAPLLARLTEDGRTFHRRRYLTVREYRMIMEELGG